MKVAGARETARVGFALLARRRRLLALTVALLVLGAATALLIPPLLGALVDAVIERKPVRDLWPVCAALLGAGVLAAAAEWAGGLLLVRCLQGALSELREQVFATALTLDLAVVEEAGSADVVSRVTGDVEAVTEAVSGVLPRFLQALFTIALTAVGLAVLDPWLALAALLAVPVQAFATVRFLRRSRPLYIRLRREEALRGQVLIEAVAGADTVRAYRQQQEHLDRIAVASTAAVQTQRTAARERNRFFAGLNGAEYLGLAAVLVTGFWRATTAGLSIGSVTAGALFFHRLFGPIGALLGSIDDLQRAMAGLERLVGVLQTAPVHGEPGQEIKDAGVHVSGVSFRYAVAPEREVLSDVTLTVEPGSKVVLVGASGSGKSTLARLLAGFEKPGQGYVLIGGEPAFQARRYGRPAVLLVTQETHLFTGTLAENLRLARPDASDEELREALRAVGLNAELDAAPVDQAQRIALARVLLADPAVVILDEATADDTMEEALNAVTAGRTSIVIAHRLSQTRDADLVAVFDGGRIVEVGAHAELLNQHGVFARLWTAWDSAA
nr:ABC transporter ATP-binding protein [Kineosporia babensis]